MTLGEIRYQIRSLLVHLCLRNMLEWCKPVVSAFSLSRQAWRLCRSWGSFGMSRVWTWNREYPGATMHLIHPNLLFRLRKCLRPCYQGGRCRDMMECIPVFFGTSTFLYQLEWKMSGHTWWQYHMSLYCGCCEQLYVLGVLPGWPPIQGQLCQHFHQSSKPLSAGQCCFDQLSGETYIYSFPLRDWSWREWWNPRNDSRLLGQVSGNY